MFALQRFNVFLEKIGYWGTVLFMAVMAVVIPYEVIGRYVFQSMSTWSGEVSTYSLAWASMLGGAAGLKKGYQIKMTSVVDMMPRAVAKFLTLTAHLFTLFFFGYMFYYGLYQTIYNVKQFSPGLEIVMSIPYASLPAGFFMMFFFTLEEFIEFLGLGEKGSSQ
jgi:TRAP-type C4-dicarboxylate transport system permease small subunit